MLLGDGRIRRDRGVSAEQRRSERHRRLTCIGRADCVEPGHDCWHRSREVEPRSAPRTARTPGEAAATPADAATAPTNAATASAATSTATTAASASTATASAAAAASTRELDVAILRRSSAFLVEDVEGGEADVGNFFFAERDLMIGGIVGRLRCVIARHRCCRRTAYHRKSQASRAQGGQRGLCSLLLRRLLHTCHYWNPPFSRKRFE